MLDGLPRRIPLLQSGVFRLALAFLFTAGIAWLAPWQDVLLPDDEGFELMKAWLLQRGHGLYTEIWCDQPPLHTLLLSGTFHLLGTSVATGRLLALAFTALAFWTVGELVGRRHGTIAAALAMLALAVSPGFTRMAAGCTLMLPAIAVGLLAIVLIEPARQRGGWPRLALAGTVLGLAMQIKFIAVIVLPLAAWEVFRPMGDVRGWRPALVRWGAWSGGAVAAFLAGLLAFPEATADLIWTPHLSAGVWAAFAEGGTRLHSLLLDDADLLVLAAAGLCLGVVRRQTCLVPPVLLLVVAYAGHLWLRPFWDYYYLHLALPLAWLVAGGARELTLWVAETASNRALAGRFILVTALFTPVLARLPARAEQARESLRSGDPIARQVLADTLRHRTGEWVFTDHPGLAFQAGVPVPPEVAVLSQKRVRLGLFTDADLVRCLERRQPGVVALGAGLPLGEVARAHLTAHYQPPMLAAGFFVYLRQPVAVSP